MGPVRKANLFRSELSRFPARVSRCGWPKKSAFEENAWYVASLVKGMDRAVRRSKGFLFEADDMLGAVVCRDVRGFPVALLASRDRSPCPPHRLVVVSPDLAMEDWFARWAEDVDATRRSLAVTRRTDGCQIRAVGTLLAYGYGVDTVIQLEWLARQVAVARASDRSPARSAEPASLATNEKRAG